MMHAYQARKVEGFLSRRWQRQRVQASQPQHLCGPLRVDMRVIRMAACLSRMGQLWLRTHGVCMCCAAAAASAGGWSTNTRQFHEGSRHLVTWHDRL